MVVAVAVLIQLAAALGATRAVAAGAIVVNTMGDIATNDGACSLREAIISANTDTASGASAGECPAGSGTDSITFRADGVITLAADLPAIISDLSIDGGGAVTVHGADAYAPFTIGDIATVTLAGMTVTRGFGANYAPGWGGGIFNAGTLTVKDSTISDNYADEGGGIFNIGTLTVVGSTLSDNRGNVTPGGGSGGGIGGVDFDGNTTVINSTVTGNSSGGCGGIANKTVTIADSTISDNYADSGTGGICGGTVSVTRSTISGNGTYEGGGGISASTVTLVDSTVTKNGGGGVTGDQVIAINSTIAGNLGHEYQTGLGIWATTLVLKNSIVAGNTGPSGADIDATSLTKTASIVGIPKGRTLADILDPAGLADHGGPTRTIALVDAFDNPALEFGDPSICGAAPVSGVDQRGEPRAATACDIGAFELQKPYPRSGFTDIGTSSFRWDIEWLWAAGITKGCTATEFCPTVTVTRGQMAAFLDRGLELPDTSSDYFTDDEASSFEDAINRLAASGITRGCSVTKFCPTATVTRGQMAAFLDRALALPITTTDYFTDDETSTFENAINRLAAAGITKGCTATTFCPTATVTRGQMAAFLRRGLVD